MDRQLARDGPRRGALLLIRVGADLSQVVVALSCASLVMLGSLVLLALLSERVDPTLSVRARCSTRAHAAECSVH